METTDRLFELRRRTFDSPRFRGIEFIEVEAKTIINKVPSGNLPFGYTINPYRGCSHACLGCFARVTHTYMDLDPDREWGTKIVVKVNASSKLRFELAAKRWKGEPIAMGTSTDPYQRAEGRYALMPGIIRAMTDYRNPFSILTRSPLILRDLDQLVDASRVTDVHTAFSVPTLDEEAWRKTEPGTPHPRKRIEAMRTLNGSGIPCGVMVAPVIPGLTDDTGQLRDVVEAAIDAGATHVTPILLHLRPVVREHFMGWLEENHPELIGSYEDMYRRSAYGPKEDRSALANRVRSLVAGSGGLRLLTKPTERDRRRGARGRGTTAPQGQQLELL